MFTSEQLSLIVKRSAGRYFEIPIDEDGAREIACQDQEALRVLNRLKRQRLRSGNGAITGDTAKIALGRMEIDELGSDLIDRLLLTSMIKNYNGGPVGLETIAATIGEEAVTIEDVYEPYLMQIRISLKTPRGRVVTVKAYEHLKV